MAHQTMTIANVSNIKPRRNKKKFFTLTGLLIFLRLEAGSLLSLIACSSCELVMFSGDDAAAAVSSPFLPFLPFLFSLGALAFFSFCGLVFSGF